MSQVAELADHLLQEIQTTKQLRQVSNILESLAANKDFKLQSQKIADDEYLSPSQKASQIQNLFSSIKSQQLREFFQTQITPDTLWLFAASRFDHFDEFVKTFQMQADKIQIIYLVTAIELSDERIQEISQEFQQTLGNTIILSHQTNPKIIGGVQVRVNNLVFDYSLHAKLEYFKKQWIKSLNQASDQLSLEDQIMTT